MPSKTKKAKAEPTFDSICPGEFNKKERSYFRTLHNFYSELDKDELDRLEKIIHKKSHISLRIFDSFVTGYANDNKTTYYVLSDGLRQRFCVWVEYKAQLVSYKKIYFDPFRRNKKLTYKCGKLTLKTSLGQLNFFKWAIINGVVDYVEENYDEIAEATRKKSKEAREKKKKQLLEVKKLKKKCKSATKTIKMKNSKDIKVTAKTKVTKDKLKIFVSFD